MLSFSLEETSQTIQISCDEKGFQILVDAINKIRPTGGHKHLLAPSRGGNELDERTPRGKEALSEVIINWVGE